jgi:hypothetical protein
MSLKNVLHGLVGVSSVPTQTYVDDVFSTYLYTGNGSTQTINNGIALVSATGFSTNVVSTTGSLTISCSTVYGSDIYIGGYVTESTYARLVVIKLSGGSVVWSKTIRDIDYGPHDFNALTSIKVDSTGVYVSGGVPSSAVWYTIVCKFDLTGTLLWQTSIKTNSDLYPAVRSKLTIDASNQVYIASTASDSGDGYIQITKLTSSGVQSWSKKLESGGPSSCNIAYDPLTSSIIVSSTFPTYTILIKIASLDGTLSWSRILYYTTFVDGATPLLRVRNILVDSSSNIILYCLGCSMTSSISQTGHIIKLNSSGTTIYSKANNSSLRMAPYYDFISCVDSSDSIYVSSYNYHENSLNYISKFNSSGTLIWTRTLSYGEDAVRGMLISGNNLLITCHKSVSNKTEILTLDKDNPTDSANSSIGVIGSYSATWEDSTAYGTMGNSATDGGTTYGVASAIVVATPSLTIASPVGTLSNATSNTSAKTSTGGMVWAKQRSSTENHYLFDTARGVNTYLKSSNTDSQTTVTATLPAFNSNGFGVGSNGPNTNATTYASWTFRKAAKFFDIVTYTGDGTTGERAFTNPLGCTVGMVIIKPISGSGNWIVSNVGMNSYYGSGYVTLNTQDSRVTLESSLYGQWSTFFTIHHHANNEGGVNSVNTNGVQYIAYLFAHDPSADGIIQCGLYTKNGYTHIDLGWEPQFILTKKVNTTSNWFMTDSMRGLTSNLNFTSKGLAANLNSAEFNTNYGIDATGFRDDISAETNVVMYMAIRMPNKPPTSGTQVFAVTNGITEPSSSPLYIGSGFSPDLVWFHGRYKLSTYPFNSVDRLRGSGNTLYTATNGVENSSFNGFIKLDNSSSAYITAGDLYNNTGEPNQGYLGYSFKRAPGFFDVVCYTGDATNGHTINHNLGVVPEFVICMCRSIIEVYYQDHHYVYTASRGINHTLALNSSSYNGTTLGMFTLPPTSTQLTLRNVAGDGNSINASNGKYVMYLFATLAGISKVGSYTGNGSSQNINCGFVAGARFVLIKRTDSTGDWYVWDTSRGILSGNDPHLSLNTTAAEVTADDSINPLNAGFTVNQTSATNINVSSATYIYLAIA